VTDIRDPINCEGGIVLNRRKTGLLTPCHKSRFSKRPLILIVFIEAIGIALLSQEGSVIAFFAMTRGVVPQTKCFA